MHEDLRRRALESTKTVSRKAKSKQTSATGSKTTSEPTSRSASRVTSRNPSDDEDAGDLSDVDAWSTASIEAIIAAQDEKPDVFWHNELSERVARILDRNRKNASQAGREEDLALYVSILRGRYCQPQITPQITPLYAAFIKAIKADASEREVVLALTAIAMTTITDPNTEEGLAYEACNKTLLNVIHEHESVAVKQEAIQVLGLVTFFSSDDDAIEQEIMPLLQSVIESDGAQVSAEDSHEVVTAAIEAWTLLITLVDEAEEATSQIIDALVDQLSSTQASVQIAAGQAIALLYEKSYVDCEWFEELAANEDKDDEEDDFKDHEFEELEEIGKLNLPHAIPNYQPYRRKDELLATLASLSKVTTKSRRKQELKELHTAFADIHQTVEEPRLGPRYSTQLQKGTNQPVGSRMSIKVGKNEQVTIDKWWKLIRLEMLRRWLKGGFLEHYGKNETVIEMVPVLVKSRGKVGSRDLQ